eukprot:32802-Eustigmatos_ZCMA.PRE.1
MAQALHACVFCTHGCTDDTPYAGGTFSVKLLLGQRFPTDPPRGFFNTKIWHPNISNTGEICVNTLKK